jgi:hypothetical protein
MFFNRIWLVLAGVCCLAAGVVSSALAATVPKTNYDMAHEVTRGNFHYGPKLTVELPWNVTHKRSAYVNIDCEHIQNPAQRPKWGVLTYGLDAFKEWECIPQGPVQPNGQRKRLLLAPPLALPYRDSYRKYRHAAIRIGCRDIKWVLDSNKREHKLRRRFSCSRLNYARGGPPRIGGHNRVALKYRCPGGQPWAPKEATLFASRTVPWGVKPHGLKIGKVVIGYCGKGLKPDRERGLWLNINFRKHMRHRH